MQEQAPRKRRGMSWRNYFKRLISLRLNGKNLQHFNKTQNSINNEYGLKMDCVLCPEVDPEIYACIVLGQNCLLGLKEDFLGNSSSVIYIYLL